MFGERDSFHSLNLSISTESLLMCQLVKGLLLLLILKELCIHLAKMTLVSWEQETLKSGLFQIIFLN